MVPAQTALRFSGWALEFMAVRPFSIISALVVVSLIWAALRQRPFHNQLWKPSHWLVLSQLLFFPAAIALGALWPNPTINPAIHHPPNRSAILCLNVLLYGSLASCAFWIWRMKSFRWFGSSLMALIELPTLSALFIAAMSVTGDWL
jgi:hypothetical protein